MIKNSSITQIEFAEAMELIKGVRKNTALLDVRSEDEFARGHVPGFVNIPILNNEHRHLVGLKYKQSGQDEAIKLGMELVQTEREKIIERWCEQIELSENKIGLVMCWRGGLRSRISSSWLQEVGKQVFQMRGGIKALRNQLLLTFEKLPPLVVLTGFTGSGKTQLLHELTETTRAVLDLEGIAEHRGSSFGRFMGKPQPSQQYFENSIALCFYQATGRIVVEDESRLVGDLVIPEVVKTRMNLSPVVVLRTDLEQRVRLIFNEYVLEPLNQGYSPQRLSQDLIDSVRRISRKLGGQLAEQMIAEISKAFSLGAGEISYHSLWISELLTQYYDKLYLKAIESKRQRVIFEGDYQQCNHFLRDYLK